MAETQSLLIDEKKKTPKPTGNFYNLYILLESTTAISEVSELEENLKNLIEKLGGAIKKTDKFIKKDLAYPIKKAATAYAGSVYFYMHPEKMMELKEGLKELRNSLLRFILIKTSPKIPDKKVASTDTLRKLDEQLEKIEEKTKEKVGTGIGLEKVSTEKPQVEKGRVTIEDIDKKLDEIMGNL